jgi:hypothetical protein
MSQARHQWLTPEILATWEADIRRTAIQGQPGQRDSETLISKITRAKWTGGVAQALSLSPSPTRQKKKPKNPDSCFGNYFVYKQMSIIFWE